MRRIASYKDYRRAALAAEHLEQAGFDVTNLQIVVRDFDRRPVRSDSRFWREASQTVLAATASALVSVVLLVAVGGVSMAGRYVSFVLVAVGAVVAGVLIAAFLHLRHGGGISRRRVVPARYDVEYADEADGAEHELARWWGTGLDGSPRTPRGYAARGSRRSEAGEGQRASGQAPRPTPLGA